MKLLKPHELEQLKSIDCYNIDTDVIECISERIEQDYPTGGATPAHAIIPGSERYDDDVEYVRYKLDDLLDEPSPELCKQGIKDIIERVTGE
jgi:hypothetical protein